jgi:hypothetical protein
MDAMLRARAVLFFLLLLVASPATTQAPAPAPATTILAPGVEYRYLTAKSPAGEPWSIHVLEVSRAEKSIEIRAVAGTAADGSMERELPTAMAAELGATGAKIVAVVNGDYDLPAPYLGVSDGLSVTSGRLWTTGQRERPTMALLRSGEPTIGVAGVTLEMTAGKRRWEISALNKPFGAAWGTGPRLYTRDFRPAVRSDASFAAIVIGGVSRGLPLGVDVKLCGVVREQSASANEVAIPPDGFVLAQRLPPAGGPEASSPFAGLKPGDKVQIRIRVTMAGKKNIREAIGGFPILVENGRRSIVGTPGANLRLRHPRTATCTNERKIIFVVVDGRQPQLSVGMTLEELADLMVSLGCTTAMNTDGGGSSVMAVAQPQPNGAATLRRHDVGPPRRTPLQIVNPPSDGRERGRGNAWVIVRR